MAYTIWSVVYGEQPSASKWNILGSNDAHFYTFLGDNLAWQSYTPTFANFTQGASTVVSKYIYVGKWTRVSVKITLGAGFALTASGITLTTPTAANAYYTATTQAMIGNVRCSDITGSNYYGMARFTANNIVMPLVLVTSGTYSTMSGIASTIPFTWATPDVLLIEFEYEAA